VFCRCRNRWRATESIVVGRQLLGTLLLLLLQPNAVVSLLQFARKLLVAVLCLWRLWRWLGWRRSWLLLKLQQLLLEDSILLFLNLCLEFDLLLFRLQLLLNLLDVGCGELRQQWSKRSCCLNERPIRYCRINTRRLCLRLGRLLLLRLGSFNWKLSESETKGEMLGTSRN